MPGVLIVALSARSLALAARRAGYRPIVLDLFGDSDTRHYAAASAVVPGDLGEGFDGPALIAAAGRLAPARAGLVYGSGLEARPDLLAELARGRRLWGNRPAVLAAIKDPAAFFALLDRLGLPHPEIRATAPADPAAWLVKRVGAAGGGHIQRADGAAAPLTPTLSPLRGAREKKESAAPFLPSPASRERVASASEPGEGRATATSTPGHYYQRRVSGRPVSGIFLADGRRGVLLGWSEQWPSPAPGQPFRFGGAAQPALLDPAIAAHIEAALPALVEATGLVGLNSIDMMVAEDGAFSLLEINPRPGASLDIFDGAGDGALFGRHVAACEGLLPGGWRSPTRATAMAVVYADGALDVPVEAHWPDWLADRPAPGARIEPTAPVCTVMAEADSAAAARALVLTRNHRVLDALASGNLSRLEESPALAEAAVAEESWG